MQNLQTTMLDLYPDRGTYLPGESVKLILELNTSNPSTANLQLNILRGNRTIDQSEMTTELSAGLNRIEWHWQPPIEAPAGYGAEVSLLPQAENPDRINDKIQTAVDVVPGWTTFPRYGFLCDFSPGRTDAAETLQALAKYHINGLQFYDWQYRHDNLLPDQDEFTDPLGRRLSLTTVLALVNAAHAHGMTALPYLAIYAASAVFWRSHPDWALYDRHGKPIPFGEDFLGLMNPVSGGPWQQHLLEECSRVLSGLPFDGLHVDQYGEPKEVYDQNGRRVDLPAEFAHFVRAAVEQHPGKSVIFNAVGNWPIKALADAPTAFNYIEIWPPDTSYNDLVWIVRNARRLSNNKPVVIALYLPANRLTNIRLANALIHSAGGSRIQLGEKERLLSDPYFPKHEPLPEELRIALRRTADFVVWYSDWFGPAIPEVFGIPVKAPNGVSTFLRRTRNGWSVSMVNLTGLETHKWDEDHEDPQPLQDFSIELGLPDRITKVWLTSPDDASLQARMVDMSQRAGVTSLRIPQLRIWDVLFFEIDQE